MGRTDEDRGRLEELGLGLGKLGSRRMDAERRFIADCVASIVKAIGQHPVGWNAYWMRNSPHTLDILQSLGFKYHIDEPSMDTPFIVKLKGGDFVTVPYTFHMNDIVSFPFENYALPPMSRRCGTNSTSSTRKARASAA